MAGNCIRCVGKFLYDNDIVKKEKMSIETNAGVKHLKVYTRNGKVTSVTVQMGKATLNPQKVPVNLEGEKNTTLPAYR